AVAKLSSVVRANIAARSRSQPTGWPKPGGPLRRALGDTVLAWAVVVIVSVVVAAEDPVTLTGVDVQDIPGPGPEKLQPTVTVPVNPYRGVMVIVAVPDCPGAGMLMLVGFAATPKSVT